MASQAAANPYQELVECPLCLDQLKSPKLLPCGHGFCLDPCLRDSMKTDIKGGKYKEGKIRCPMCKTDHTVEGLDSLPPDHKANTLISLIEQDKQKQVSEDKLSLCSVCDGEKRNTACIYCISCRETMCILCQKQHEQKPENSQHATMSLNEKSMTVLMCKQHPKRYIVQYCDTCRHSVCNVCVIQSHGTHIMNDFRKINSGSWPGALITKLKNDLGSLKSDTAQKERQISDLILTNRAQNARTQEEITCHVDALITSLQQQKVKLQTEKQQSQKECESHLLSQHKMCKDINQEIVNCEEKLDRITFPFENSQEIVLDKVPQKAFTPVIEDIAKLERRCKDIVLEKPATHRFVPNNSSYEAGHMSHEADSKHSDVDTSSSICTSKGPSLTEEGYTYIRRHGDLQDSEIAVTTAGWLHCKKVIHAVGPQWPHRINKRNKDQCIALLKATFLNVLERCSQENFRSVAIPAISSGPGDDWTWEEQVMIRWTRSPIQISLLELSPEYNKIALECFINVMRYMGDYPLGKDQRLVDSALFILLQCHNYSAIRDEVYCQLIKQTTNNRSTNSDSETMGWRLLSIIAAFFDVSDTLQPYLIKYLESVAYDNNRNNQAVVGLCLENIRKTMRYGGRKNVPSRIELDAVTRGRISKRQSCMLPGGAPVVLNVKSSSVVLDILDQVSISLGIVDSVEKEEYSLFYVIEDGNIYCTMEKNEYIFDVTTQLVNDKRDYYILFQRTSWVVPLYQEPRNQMYVDVMYHQVVPDYLDGFLLPLPNRSLPNHIKDEIALLGALQLRVMEKRNTPTQIETAAVIPKTVHMFGGMTLNQWSNQVFHRVFEVYELPSDDAKLQFIDKLSKWPLFGSTFFNVKSVNDPKVPGNVRLGISRNGVSFFNMDKQVTLTHYPLQDIISTRRATQERGKRYLDMEIGNLMQQKVIRIETDQCKDIGNLIGQYSSVAQDLPKR